MATWVPPNAHSTKAKHKTFKIMAKNQKSQVAKNTKNVTLEKNDGKKQIKPYCEEARKLAEQKRIVDDLRPIAAAWLQEKLDSDPETKDFTGTVVCVYDGVLYKIRVQRRASCNWREKNLKDPNLKALKELYTTQDGLKAEIAKLEEEMVKAHPKCIARDFVISFLSK